MSVSLLALADYVAMTGDQTMTQQTLDAASGIVQAYCKWPVGLESGVTVNLSSDGSSVVLLPSLYVTDVSALSLNGTDQAGNGWPSLTAGVDWDWDEDGELVWLASWCSGWPAGKRRVQVTYTSGYDPVPGAVVAAVRSLAPRVKAAPMFASMLNNVGGVDQNVTYSSVAQAGLGLSSIEAAVLDTYRIASAR